MFSISSSSFPSFSHEPNTNTNTNTNPNPIPNPPAKRKRNLPGTPDPDAEVIALSPTSLMATNRFVCEVCNKGFQRDQNLQLHRRGHNLPWKLKQRSTNAAVRKKVYICPERSCVHHEASRALGDLTGIKKHFSRKHGEKRWKCEKCSKKYAVQSDWKAHSKTCGTRQYKCDCGTLFSRKDSFITHRAFCDALTDESARTSVISSLSNTINFNNNNNNGSNALANTTRTHNLPPLGFSRQDEGAMSQFVSDMMPSSSDHNNILYANSNNSTALPANTSLSGSRQETLLSPKPPAAPMSATALLQKAAQVGSTSSKFSTNGSFGLMRSSSKNQDRRSGNDDVGMADLERIMMQSLGKPKLNTGSTGPTRDFMGVGGESSRFMQDELARFASFGPRAAMGFGQFADNH